MADKKYLSLQEEELFSEEVRELFSEEIQFFSCLYDKTQKSYKEKDVVRNVCNSIAGML